MSDNREAAAYAAASSFSDDELVREIHAEIKAAEEGHREALAHAIRAGALLTEAKQRVQHGHWLTWLEENFSSNVRTAQRYMTLFSNATSVSHLKSVNEALAVVRSTQKPKKAKPRNAAKQDTIRGAKSFTHNPAVIEWVRKHTRKGMTSTEIIAASQDTNDWPDPENKLTDGSLTACRTAIHHLEHIGAAWPLEKNELAPRKGRPKESGTQLRRLRAERKKKGESKLLNHRYRLMEAVGVVEACGIPEFGIGTADQEVVTQVHEELTILARLVDASLEVVVSHMDDIHARERIRKLREDTKGRTEPEIDTARRLADRLERKMERVLTDGAESDDGV